MRTLISLVIVVAFFAFTGASESADKKDKKKGAGTTISGKVTDIDAEKGFITLMVVTTKKKDKVTSSPQYKIDDDTKVILEDNKEVAGKEGLKRIKEGAQVTVTLSSDFKTISVKVGAGGKK